MALIAWVARGVSVFSIRVSYVGTGRTVVRTVKFVGSSSIGAVRLMSVRSLVGRRRGPR